MKIIRHRGQDYPGYMKGNFEVDVRLSNERLICCHDIQSRNIVTYDFRQFLHRWNDENGNLLAINVKEDGLAPYIFEELTKERVPFWKVFCFDMAQTEIPAYLNLGIPIATRASDYGIEEPVGEYVWLDKYVMPGDFTLQKLCGKVCSKEFGHKFQDKKVIGVSPELHGCYANIYAYWHIFKEFDLYGVCTKKGDEAEKFFNGNESCP